MWSVMILLRIIPQPCLDPPKSKWHKGQSRLLNQTFISAECVRSIRLSTDKSQVFSVDCTACESCPLALSLIGRTRNWPYNIYLNRGCACVAHISCCRDRARVRSSGNWHARTHQRSIGSCHAAATNAYRVMPTPIHNNTRLRMMVKIGIPSN